MISTEFLCKENTVRQFAQTSLWKAPEPLDLIAVVTKNIKRPSEPYELIYKAGGINKLILEAGIVDSYHFLVNQENQKPSQVFLALSKVLIKMHEASLQYVISKTFRTQYENKKKFDISKLLKPIIAKRGLLEYHELRYDSLFLEK